MKLKDLRLGQRFLFVDDKVSTDIYVKKKEADNKYCIVGLPDVYDEFAALLESEVVTEDS